MNINKTMEDLQGVDFHFLSYLWQPDIEIHHVREVREPKVMFVKKCTLTRLKL